MEGRRLRFGALQGLAIRYSHQDEDHREQDRQPRRRSREERFLKMRAERSCLIVSESCNEGESATLLGFLSPSTTVPRGSSSSAPYGHRPAARANPIVEGWDVRVSCLKLAKLGPMPLALASAKVDTLPNNSVTQFVVQYSRDPLTRGWFEELARHNHSSLPDVT